MKGRSQTQAPGLVWEYLLLTTEADSTAALAEYGA
jgi:hypothetical protein